MAFVSPRGNLPGEIVQKENLMIMGAGPAGLTAAICAARANLNPLVIIGNQAGGQIAIRFRPSRPAISRRAWWSAWQPMACLSLPAISPTPEVFKGQLAMDEQNFLVVDKYMQTSVPGIFASGEVMDPTYKQAVASAGQGCQAAISAERYLEALADPA
jgi:thioredoxin reductase